MASLGEDLIETAALGRPFHLGMLYDCKKDAIVPGVMLWDREQLQKNTNYCPHVNTEFTVTTSDSIEEKAQNLRIDDELKLSLLAELVTVNGAARYFKDNKKSFRQRRLTLHYRTTTRFEQLTVNHLAHGKMVHSEVSCHEVATHVVTAVLYGADAYFLFDRDVNSSEDKKNIQGELNTALDQLKSLFSGSDLNKNQNKGAVVNNFSCTFYGDFTLLSNPTTFEDAVKVYADLPNMLGDNGEHAVPVKVWLYPLDKLNLRASRFQRSITTDLSRAVESVIEALNIAEMKCGDLLRDTVAKSFNKFHDHVEEFRKFCCEYKKDFLKELGSLLPEIRGGKTDINALKEILEAHNKSPFNSCDLQQWVEVKEKESNQINVLLKQLHGLGAEVDDDVDKYLLDLNVENLVAYAFTCLQNPDHLLIKQELHLKPSVMRNNIQHALDHDFQKNKWTSEDLMFMKKNLMVFKNLITANKSQSTKFIVQSLPQSSDYPSSCILLYENGCSDAIVFVPPSKPASPVIEGITEHSITVKLSPQCAATLERKLLYKISREDDWKSQSVHQDIITLEDLEEDTEHEVKIQEVGKLGYVIESDAINVKTEDQIKLKPHRSQPNQKVVGEHQNNKNRDIQQLTSLSTDEENADQGSEAQSFKEACLKHEKTNDQDGGVQEEKTREPEANLQNGSMDLVEKNESQDEKNKRTDGMMAEAEKEKKGQNNHNDGLKQPCVKQMLALSQKRKKKHEGTEEKQTENRLKEEENMREPEEKKSGHTENTFQKEGMSKEENDGQVERTIKAEKEKNLNEEKTKEPRQQSRKGRKSSDREGEKHGETDIKERSQEETEKKQEDTTKMVKESALVIKNKIVTFFNGSREKAYITIRMGNTPDCCQEFLNRLHEKKSRLKQVDKEEDSRFILVFCPVVSQVVTDIEAALHRLNKTSETKPAVLVMLHCTNDPKAFISESRRCVKRERTIAVDCVFQEDNGLYKCEKNDRALEEVMKWIKGKPQEVAI